mgnify:CR=1 FL=1
MLIWVVGDGERDWGALHYIYCILPDSQCTITIHNTFFIKAVNLINIKMQQILDSMIEVGAGTQYKAQHIIYIQT